MPTKELSIPYKSIVSVLLLEDIRQQLRMPENIRYGRYRTDEKPQEFARLLGGDVRFVSHPGVTFGITRSFIEAQNKDTTRGHISEEDAFLLLTASIVHDWGELKIEGLGHGDVTFEQHTAEHEKTEGTIFERIIQNIPDTADREYVKSAYKKVVTEKESPLGKIFNAIERIGYLKTGLRAYVGLGGQRIKNWSGLTGNVLSNQINRLLEYQPDYRLVWDVLNENSGLISRAFADVSLQENQLASDGKPSYSTAKFNQAQSAWDSAMERSGYA